MTSSISDILNFIEQWKIDNNPNGDILSAVQSESFLSELNSRIAQMSFDANGAKIIPKYVCFDINSIVQYPPD